MRSNASARHMRTTPSLLDSWCSCMKASSPPHPDFPRIPWMMILLAFLILVTYAPQISLFLPEYIDHLRGCK